MLRHGHVPAHSCSNAVLLLVLFWYSYKGTRHGDSHKLTPWLLPCPALQAFCAMGATQAAAVAPSSGLLSSGTMYTFDYATKRFHTDNSGEAASRLLLKHFTLCWKHLVRRCCVVLCCAVPAWSFGVPAATVYAHACDARAIAELEVLCILSVFTI